MTAIWDEAFLKQHARDAREMALAAQSDDDCETAEMLLERAMSDSVGGCIDCPLPACRREVRCVGNRPICMPRCAIEFEPGVEQELFEQFYAEIQQERRDAAAQHRAPNVERVMTHRVHREEEVVDEPAPAPVRDQGERNVSVPEAPRNVASKPAPPPQLRKPEPPAARPAQPAPSAAAAPPAAPARPAPPEPPPRSPPDVEEQVNRIWAEYVASPAEFSARRRGPRIRLL